MSAWVGTSSLRAARVAENKGIDDFYLTLLRTSVIWLDETEDRR